MKVGIVIVTFNRKKLLITILNELKKQTYKKTKLYIIDNCSSDDTKEELVINNIILKSSLKINENEEEYYENEKIKYIRLNENMGGAGGFYRGIKEATEEQNDYIWLMDDDVMAEKTYLEKAMNFLNENKENNVGAVMGVRYENGIPIFAAEAKEFNFKDCFRDSFKQSFPTLEEIKEKKMIKISDFPFEGPIINCEIIKKIGYPNKDFFIIGDDTDYALRIGQISNIFMLTSLRIDRLIPMKNEIKLFTWKDYYSCRNVFYLNKKYGLNYRVKYIRNLYMVVKVIGSMIKNTIKSKKIDPIKNILKLFEAYMDSLKNNLGKKYVPGDF